MKTMTLEELRNFIEEECKNYRVCDDCPLAVYRLGDNSRIRCADKVIDDFLKMYEE